MASMSEQLRQVVSAIRKRLQQANADELAEVLGISKSNFYRVRRGGSPSLATLELLAHYFDTGQRLDSPAPMPGNQPNGQPKPQTAPLPKPALGGIAKGEPAPWD